MGHDTRAVAREDLMVLDGLIARRLFPLAEHFCQSHLDDATLDVATQGDYARGLIRVYAEQSRYTPRQDRAAIWTRVDGVLANFERRHPESPQVLLVRFQAALAYVSRGEIAYEEFASWKQQAAVNQESLDALTAAVTRLEKLRPDVDAEVRARGRAPNSAERLSDEQLRLLQGHIQFYLIKAAQLQAEGFAPRSPDRLLAASTALEYAKQLGPADVPDELWWESRLRLIRCHRLKQDWQVAAQEIDRIAATLVDDQHHLDLRAERVQLALDQQQWDAALDLVALGRIQNGVTSPLLDIAHLETYLAMWLIAQQQSKEAEVSSWQEKAMECVKQIQGEHNARWTRLAVLMSADRFGASGLTSDLETQVQAAREFYRQGDIDRAVEAFDKASKDAANESLTQPAFDLAFQAATILFEHKRQAEAVERFEQMATRWPEHPRAPRAHWIVVLHSAQRARSADPSALKQYEALLRDHVDRWPTAESTMQAHLWLGKMEEARQNWQAAARSYLAYQGEMAEWVDAIAHAWLCWERHFEQQVDTANWDHQELSRAIESLAAMSSLPADVPERVRDAALLARVALHVDFAEHIDNDLLTHLAERVQAETSDDPAWLRNAQFVLLAARLRQRDASAVKDLVEQLGNPAPAESLDRMHRIMQRSDLRDRRETGEVILQLSKNWSRPLHDVSDAQQLQWQKIYAHCLVVAGRVKQAVEEYAALAKKFPDDGLVQQTYAELLLELPDDSQLDTALNQWRSVLSRSRPGSSRWFDAKLAIAKVHMRQGDFEKAAQLIELTQAVYPELGGETRKAEFRAVLAKCRRDAGTE
jgi:tetratricopeptide (TPR) repeat protein